MALQLTRELEAIRAELPPRQERRFVLHAHSPTGTRELPEPAGLELPEPARPVLPEAPAPRSTEQVAPLHNSHSVGGFEILPGNDSPQTQGPGPF